MRTLQALPKEIQVEENIVLPTQTSFQGQKHQGSEGIWGAADVDNWGRRGVVRKKSSLGLGGGSSSDREAGALRGCSETLWQSGGTPGSLSLGCGSRKMEKGGRRRWEGRRSRGSGSRNC